MAAVDFSETGNLAIRAALPLLAPDATLTLVHVVARDISLGAWPAWDDAYLKAVNASFDLLKSQLRLPPGVTVNTVVLRGDPPGELLAWASQHKVDLLVTGSHGHNFVVRTLLGRVSTKLVRGARCSVLIAPPRLRA
jgi:nucleotide-binding universal stress UspA family protein